MSTTTAVKPESFSNWREANFRSVMLPGNQFLSGSSAIGWRSRVVPSRTPEGRTFQVVILQASDQQITIEYAPVADDPSARGASVENPKEPDAPAGPTDEKGFRPIQERTVNEGATFIDFETGELLTMPEVIRASRDTPALYRWLERSGADATARTEDSIRGLLGFDILAGPVTNVYWERPRYNNWPGALVGMTSVATDQKMSGAAHRGKDVVILDLWAIWCGSCVRG